MTAVAVANSGSGDTAGEDEDDLLDTTYAPLQKDLSGASN